jgi:hypothetical protein
MELVGESTATVILDANRLGALIQIAAPNISLTLSNLTYRNGAVAITDNFKTNTMMVVDKILVEASNEFANMTAGTLSVTDSTFDGLTGNVIVMAGDGTIDRCTFVNNTANVDAMIYFTFGNNSLTSSTLVGNSGAESAVVVNNATVTFVNNTIASNSATTSSRGGGITQYSGGTSTWTNNLLTLNNGTDGNCHFTGTMTSAGGNLAYPDGCTFNAAGDPAPADPQLGALTDNGGPTRTMALPSGSPAVNAGVSAGCAPIDQRGVTRPQGPACDIGAYELQ